MGGVDRQADAPFRNGLEEPFEVLTVHDRLVVMMVERESDTTLPGFDAKVPQDLSKLAQIGSRHSGARHAVAESDPLGADGCGKRDDLPEGLDAALIQRPAGDERRDYTRIAAPFLLEALRFAEIGAVLAALELQPLEAGASE